ncbi:MAG: radical SAM protein [Thermoleophilaceae bacterium]|nr:radical SAM protein [Thermoleophilaceae bacterium]
MLSVSRLLSGDVEPGDVLRYGRSTRSSPAHMLHFSRDKKPVVVWNVSQRCNLHCAHCYADSHNREYPGELTTEQGIAMLTDLAAFGVPTVLFSGGEPLMRPDLFELAEAARELGLRTVLSTNGTLIDAQNAQKIANAGFSYVGISIDAIGPLHDKLRGRHGAFEDAVRGIRASKAAGLRTGVRFTVNAVNRDHLGDVFDLALDEGADRLCVYHLAYAGRGERIGKLYLTPPQTAAVVEEVFDRVEDLIARRLQLEVLTVDNPVDGIALLERIRDTQPKRFADVEKLLRWNGGNQSGVAIACVDPLGNVHPDQFSWDVTVGNVLEQPFRKIWTKDNPLLAPYRRSPRQLTGRCNGCAQYKYCNGGLRVRAVSATGDFAASDPACYLSDQQVSGL